MPTLPATFPWSFGWVPLLSELEGTSLTWQSDHGQAAVDNLISQFQEKPRLAALIRGLCDGVQDLDDAVWQCLTERWLDTAVGVQLDGIGSVVGLGREGWVDETYRLILGAWLVALRSAGRWSDLVTIAIKLGATAVSVRVYDAGTAEARVTLGSYLVEATSGDLFRILERARSGGVRLTLEAVTAAADATFTLSDASAWPTSSVATGLGDASDASIGGRLAEVYASTVGV